jgi:hypothetical protein
MTTTKTANFTLAVLVSGCTATRPVSPPTAQERLMQDGKLLYELGRADEARDRLHVLLSETSDQHLRTNASYYLDRINKGLAPETAGPNAVH